jgi:hypothetical protein
MFQDTFSHKTIKNTIACFGALFSHIKIARTNSAGVVTQTINVPITYGPKEKVIVRLQQNPSLDRQVQVTLPRLAFEITNYAYDASRMPNRNNRLIYNGADGTSKAVYAPVPWNIDINLYLLTKSIEDSLDVMEQIVPSFAPEFTATILTIPELGVTQDVPFVMGGIHQDDGYEGDFNTTRLITTTFSLTAKLNLYGLVGPSSIITRTDTSVLTQSDVMGIHTSTGNPITGDVTADFWT